jgi:hypothetical protein
MGGLRCARAACLPFVRNAAQRCVRRHAGHVTERPRLGFPFARIGAAEVNYSCVQIGHAILRRHPITGAVQKGNSVTRSVADAIRNWRFESSRPAERLVGAKHPSTSRTFSRKVIADYWSGASMAASPLFAIRALLRWRIRSPTTSS